MVTMLGYDVEVEDIARVTVGVTLGLLTVYRRELSSNRAYHDEQAAEIQSDATPGESDEWSRAPSDSEGNPAEDGSPTIPRRKSLSSLHGEGMPMITDEQLQSKAVRRDAIDRARQSDHLDELLDSAGTVFSGGPFLAVGTAVLDHLVFSSLAGAYASMASSLRHSFARRVYPLDEVDTPKKSEENESPASSTVGPIHNQFIYNVAWNAASDYFSSKLASGSSADDYDGKSQRNLSMRKSKSTSNLIPLSDMQTRELLYDMIDMAGRGNMDINLLPSEQQIHVFSYLSPADLLAFTCTNLAARGLLTEAAPIDGEVETSAAEDPAEEGTYRSSGNTAILIWKALFRRDFAWILSDWQIGREALVRSLRIGCDRHPRRAGDSMRSEVLRHVLSAIAESGNDGLRSIDIDSVGSTFPLSSMKEFYFVFAETWLNYSIAGCNSTDKCLIGLHGHVFDISDFVEAHPGSTETLLIESGRDSTVSFVLVVSFGTRLSSTLLFMQLFFESIGHSRGARKLAIGKVAVVNAQCVDWNARSVVNDCDVRRPVRPQKTWGLIKPRDDSLVRRINIPGFLIPKKRSQSRSFGGLWSVRQRIKREELVQEQQAENLQRALGQNLFGGIQCFFDPFNGWQSWYTNRDFQTVYS